MNHLAFLLLKTLRGLFVKKLQVSIIKQLMLNDQLILVNIASKLIQNGIDQTYFFGYVVVRQGESEGYNFASTNTKYHLSEYLTDPRCICKFCYLLFKERIIFCFIILNDIIRQVICMICGISQNR